MTAVSRNRTALAFAALLTGIGPAAGDAQPETTTGRAAFTDRRDPPAWRQLDDATRAAFDLGLLVFNSPWVAAGTPNAGRRDGLGPLFIGASCDGCHNNGARGRPPAREGGISSSFVLQLEGPPHAYGAVLNTAALPGHAPEGQVRVTWETLSGRYADGTRWTLREPRYHLDNLAYGPLPSTTVLRPRIGPPVFGAGLLEAVPDAALQEVRQRQPRAQRGRLPAGRFGWQAEAIDIEEQTARALAREMGLTSVMIPQDDCTAAQRACRTAPDGGTPEVSPQFMQALVTLQRELAVPQRATLAPAADRPGRALFSRTGCATCHVETLTAELDGRTIHFAPWSDLLLHDLGEELADRRLDGRAVTSRWRTAPLWGQSHALANGEIALLHDGRAGSVEEAILWHGGQAAASRRAFLQLPAGERRQLLDWVGSL